MRRILIATWIFATLASCKTASGPTATVGAGGAIANVILGVTAAGISRANGGCYAACSNGTTCDPESGLCVPLPCRGACYADEHCDAVTNTCVKGADVDLGLTKDRAPVSDDYWNAAQPAPQSSDESDPEP